MRRVEKLPDEQREIDEALSRAATPTHEDTEEFNSLAYLKHLQTLQDNIYLQNLKINPETDTEDV